MKIAEWLTKTYVESPYNGIIRQKIVCADGFTISVQASAWHYCTPRATFSKGKEYTALELGYASAKDEIIEDYRDKHIYPYVPVELVDKLLEKHGGIVV